MTAPQLRARVISFGYGHGEPPAAHVTFDLRQHFRDPHAQPGLRALTAASPEVADAVLATPGIGQVLDAARLAAQAFLAGPSAGEVVIAFGCVGGRHRSAVCADELCWMLDGCGIAAVLEHRDITRPVIERKPA